MWVPAFVHNLKEYTCFVHKHLVERSLPHAVHHRRPIVIVQPLYSKAEIQKDYFQVIRTSTAIENSGTDNVTGMPILLVNTSALNSSICMRHPSTDSSFIPHVCRVSPSTNSISRPKAFQVSGKSNFGE
ncbi:hypothetical protein AcV5_008260 [Taiwanofungus camphoratus]|nr:hypothetical protein AcV5_008260 [Antrodia cinnamomea]